MIFYNCVICGEKLDERADGITVHPLCGEHRYLCIYIDARIAAETETLTNRLNDAQKGILSLSEKLDRWEEILNELDPRKRFC